MVCMHAVSVPPTKAVRSHPEGKYCGSAGNCWEEWRRGPLEGI